MTTEFQDLINLGAGAALAAMGWFAKTLWDAVQELKKDLAKLREDLPIQYTRKDDFKDFAQELREMFKLINEKLDKKADK